MRVRIFKSANNRRLFKWRLVFAAISFAIVAMYLARIVVSVYAREGSGIHSLHGF